MFDFSASPPTTLFSSPDRRVGAEVRRPSHREAGSPSYPDGIPSVPAKQKLPEDPELSVGEQVAAPDLPAPPQPLWPQPERHPETQLRPTSRRRADSLALQNSSSTPKSLHLSAPFTCIRPGSCPFSCPERGPASSPRTNTHTAGRLLL